MTNANYRRGYDLEYKTKKVLEKDGWLTMRSPASKNCMDLIALKGDKKLLIQCKKTGKESLYVYELDDIISEAKKYNATPLLVYGLYRSQVYATEITEANFKTNTDQNHVTLEQYISD